MLCGGEALPRDLADELLQNGDELWNVYGPTETTIWSSIGKVSQGSPITIGAPVLNTQLYVLDNRYELAPVGVIGQLFIGGGRAGAWLFSPPRPQRSSVLRHCRDRWRSAALVSHRRSRAAPAQWRHDEMLGRVDAQVKLRGFRIELEEIEAVMRQCEGVSACAAVIDAPTGGTPRLVGYFVPAAGQQTPSPSALTAHAALHLPDYMVPPIWVSLDALPLTPNGKLDRKSLPQPDPSHAAEKRVVTAPRTPLESKLAKIWREVLQIDEIGVHDNIFSLGADSIDLFRIAARMMAEGIGLEARHVMRLPTIGELARAANDQPIVVAPAAPSLRSFRRGMQAKSRLHDDALRR